MRVVRLRLVSASIDERRVRRVLFVVGTLFSALLAPAAVVGMFFGSWSVLGGSESSSDLEIAIVGFMATAGIIGAWTRLLPPSERFRRSDRLRWAAAVSIGLGILAALVMMYDDGASDFDVFLGTVALVGTYLLCATIGAKGDAVQQLEPGRRAS
jgi:hypothetical protein